MSNFLTGDELENKLTDIIWNAKKHIVIISPFIKLDKHMKDVLDKIKSTHEISVFIVFGKNEEYKYKSFNEEDFQFFKEFKNITILYNKNLHAKHYCNENEGLITSLNLYGYSMVNNVEYGVHFSKNLLNPLDKLFEETEAFTYDLVYKQSEVVFLKKPQFKSKLMGLQKVYQQSAILFDESDNLFNGYNYESKKLSEFDLEVETVIEKKYSTKPEREKNVIQVYNKKKESYDSTIRQTGYCIRTGVEIDFNPARPFCYNAYRSWVQFENYDYPENYCHKTGQPSNGKTSMANPILD
ncbi:phospholipase D family protein [Maribacter litoralis]|uniref:phospholipase D family protein n=1 Tax=Maribacter litoralis TaxID=2059726 RepID=UPI003F5CCDDA